MSRQGFTFLVCTDAELIKDRVAELLQDTPFMAKVFWGDEELPSGYWQALTVPAMMGQPNAVVLRRAQDQKDEFWARIEPLLAMARVSIWPFFCLEGDWQKGKPTVPKAVIRGKYWAVAQKKGWVWEHAGLNRKTLGAEVDRFAQRYGLNFAPGVRQSLIQTLPLTTIALRNEMEKILLLAGEGGTIRPSHLQSLPGEDGIEIFSFLRSLHDSAGRQKVWNHLLNDPALSSGDMVFPVSALLLREARQLWQLVHGDEDKVQLHPGMKAEKKRLAQRLGPNRISRFWDLALKADTDIKTGRLKPAQAMENLIKDVQRVW